MNIHYFSLMPRMIEFRIFFIIYQRHKFIYRILIRFYILFLFKMKSWHFALMATLALTVLYMFSVPSQGSTEFDAWRIGFGKTFTPEE